MENNNTITPLEGKALSDALKQIDLLKQDLTGNLFDDMDTKDKIHNLEMKIKGVKPQNTEINCIGCSG